MEDNNKTEAFFKKLMDDKLRFAALITSIISVIWTFIYISQMKLFAPTLIAMLFFLMAGIASIVYTIDTNGKNPHTNNIFILGIALSLAASLIRIFQMGLGLSWQQFIYYIAVAVALMLTASKLCRNKGNETVAIVLLILLVFYDLFCFFYYRNTVIRSFVWKMFYLSEALVLSTFALILITLKGKYEEFAEKLGAYKKQLPSIKICMIVLAVISALAVGIGSLLAYVKNPPRNGAISEETVTRSQKNAPEETESSSESNASAGTVIRGSDKDSADKDGARGAASKGAQPTEAPQIAVGQTVTPEGIEFTLNKVVFSHKVEPDVKPSYYSYYDSKSGQVYIYINAKVKNLGQSSIGCDEIYSVTADYNNGYTYTGFNIADDDDGDFTYANISNVDPLATKGVHYLIDCPVEVETSDKPVSLTFRFKDGSQYLYKLR